MNLILALDTSTGPASIAITQGAKLRAEHTDADAHRQSERLVCAVDTLVRATLVGYSALHAIAVTTGPGGFTGIRIALAAARGFALAANLPLLGISTLETYAWQALHDQPENTKVLTVINAYREQVYVQAFVRCEEGVNALCEAEILDLTDFNTWRERYPGCITIGNMQGLIDINTSPYARYTAWYANALLCHNSLEARASEALYIRKADAKPQKSFL